MERKRDWSDGLTRGRRNAIDELRELAQESRTNTQESAEISATRVDDAELSLDALAKLRHKARHDTGL